MQDVSFIPAIRKDKINRSGTVPLVIKVYLNNKEVAHPSIKKRVKPEEWDDLKRCVNNKNSNGILLNGILNNTLNRFENFVLKRQTLGLPVTKEILLKYLATGSVEHFGRHLGEAAFAGNSDAEVFRHGSIQSRGSAFCFRF